MRFCFSSPSVPGSSIPLFFSSLVLRFQAQVPSSTVPRFFGSRLWFQTSVEVLCLRLQFLGSSVPIGSKLWFRASDPCSGSLLFQLRFRASVPSFGSFRFRFLLFRFGSKLWFQASVPCSGSLPFHVSVLFGSSGLRVFGLCSKLRFLLVNGSSVPLRFQALI